MGTLPDFETPRLAAAVEKLSADELNSLPFGVIKLDDDGNIQVFNETEAKLSGYGRRPIDGKKFFVDVAPCMHNGYFSGQIEKAKQAGKLDITFTFTGDFSDRDRELSVRVQSASDGGTWIFIARP